MRRLERRVWLFASFAVVALGLLIPVASGGATAPTVSGGSPQQVKLLQQLLSATSGSITDVQIAAPPPSFGQGSWLRFGLEPSDDSPTMIRENWEAYLVAGDFRDASASMGLPTVVGASFAGGGGVIGGDDHPPVTIDSADQVDLANNVTSAGLSLVSLTYLDLGQGLVPVVTASASDPAAFLRAHPQPTEQIFGDINNYDGTYLELQNEDGQAVYVSAYASRASSGIGWIKPGLAPLPSSIQG